jgi:hypothetical protein
MTNHIALTADASADIRWREWQARGAEGDRRSAATMGGLTVLVSNRSGVLAVHPTRLTF